MQPNGVDQDIDARIIPQQNARRFANIRQVTEVGEDNIDPGAMPGRDVLSDTLGFPGIPADHDNMRASPGKAFCGGQSYA